MSLGSQIAAALEEEGARWVFGIPGVHTIELYDALGRSKTVEPVLVTHECGGAFMADAVSRTSDSVGVICVVPGAGVTHALSGIAEALLDGVPMVVLASAVPRDTGRAYQLHDVDQRKMLAAATKAVLSPARPEEVYSAVRRAFALARAGCPGPVAVELPADFFMRQSGALAPYDAALPQPPRIAADKVRAAARLLNAARRPMIYAGWGARGAAPELLEAARLLQAPVATTIQGKGVFPESHPLWLWNGFGRAAPPFAREIAGDCDAMLAIGCRFSEVGTGSYGIGVPENLIHVDADTAVFNKNYRAALAVEADAAEFLKELIPMLSERPRDAEFIERIRRGLGDVERHAKAGAVPGALSPRVLFSSLQKAFGSETVFTVDSGQGMFHAMENLRLEAPSRLIGPVDYSCMGYAVPAAVGAKLVGPERPVVAVVGDGALLMTGLELLTAARRGLGVAVCVLRDGELGQIAQFQRRVLGKQTAALVAPYELKDLAAGLRCRYLRLENDDAAASILDEASKIADSGTPVVIEALMDCRRETFFARGVVAANFSRLPAWDKARMVARAAVRKVVP